MRGRFVQQRRNDEEESEEPRFVVVKKIRDAILDESVDLREAVIGLPLRGRVPQLDCFGIGVTAGNL